MEQQRLLLTIGLSLLLYVAYDTWQLDFGPKPVASVSAPLSTTSDRTDTSADVPMGSDNKPASHSAVPSAESAPVISATKIQQAQRILVETDTLRVEIDSRGGDVRVVDLLKYPKATKGDKESFRLMTDDINTLFIAQSGFAGKKESADSVVAAPNHNTVYKVENTEYKLADGKNSLVVNLYWTSPEGVRFTKIYEFKRDSYQIKVSHKIENGSQKMWRGNAYQQLQRKEYSDENQSSFIYTYTGGVLYSPENKYEKINYSDMADREFGAKLSQLEIKEGWAAMIQHYFLAAWVPEKEAKQHYFTRDLGDSRYAFGMKASEEVHVDAGQSAVVANTLFVGPKLQDRLEELAPGLELTVDYGFLTFIAKPIFILMKYIHQLVNNWGWTIILLTLLIKLVFYKLSEASYKSMANMKKIQPRMVALKERFGDDRQKMNAAMMEMYKKEKINPLGGCLPILVQIPVFIALYWVLLESVELRQAHWIFWLNDLSTKDPYFVLPLLMGITMFIQQKLNPAPMDPIQAKIMMALPVVFTVFFAFFPSGLVLYWVVNNALSIAQQWYITRIVIKS